MDAKTEKEIDESMRLIAVGSAVLDEAEDNPAVRAWLDKLLDTRLTDRWERELFGLTKKPPPETPPT
jgi:hypothetical protein